ncbi:PREDICTED: uncharacterized protein LOC109221761 [Nicotiana attenuata]|uniref:uncharacterized protein LOC109221761 n=1 Tax=Nicotiana attenuata TaxID=49451 RepID=UPI000904FE03|nr:PREDICTED: uncharacterized protein LOC109221761 [Nicotiana attenuata]
MKNRSNFNGIQILTNDMGTQLVIEDDIEAEILGYYKKLLGPRADNIPAINPNVMKLGAVLNIDQQLQLIKPVTKEEEWEALKEIGDLKALGYDGFNVVFFKKSWQIIGENVTQAVLEFFETTQMYRPINCTAITLVPKVRNPASIKDTQSAFVPGRVITDNIILSHELVKGYGRKGVQNTLAFPEQFVRCIMICMETVTYTVLINGALTKPSEARKGLRQGDPISPFMFLLAMEYLARSLKTLNQIPDFNYHPKWLYRISQVTISLLHGVFKGSGLVINKNKSSIFFGGVTQDAQEKILEFLGIQRGDLPVRYLGAPLSTKRISIAQCQPLIEKIVGRITSWTAKFLSYAGRIQLIKSVLFSIQTYWAQIFVLPKKIKKLIEAICRSFLWIGEGNVSKKALLAWEKVCLPKSAGGFNVMNISIWNKDAIRKQYWNLCKEKKKLWIQWMHSYYIKDRNIWEIQLKQTSWMVSKIMKAKETFMDAGFSYDDIIKMNNCSIKFMYHGLRGRFDKAPVKRDISTFELHLYVKQLQDRTINVETDTELITEN